MKVVCGPRHRRRAAGARPRRPGQHAGLRGAPHPAGTARARGRVAHADGACQTWQACVPPRLTAARSDSAATGSDVAANDRTEDVLRLRATLAEHRPRHRPARRARADPARPHRRPAGARQRQDRRLDLHRRLLPRHPVHRHRAARAGQDGRRDRARQGRHPDPARRGAPDARPVDPLRGDRHPAPHRRPGGPADRLPGDLGVAVDADHRGVRRRHPLRPRGLRARSCPAPTRPSPPWSATRCASTRSPAPCPRSRSRTWSPSATWPWSPSGWRWSPGSPARSRTTCSSSAATAGCCPSSSTSWSPGWTPSASW